MKRTNYKLLNFCYLCLLLIPLSCKKNTQCIYETTCVETEPAGFMVGTMASDPGSSNRVATIFRTANNASAPIGDDWNDPVLGASRVQSTFPNGWVKDSIGQVFGIALDHNGGVFLSATDIYRYDERYGGVLGPMPTGYGSVGGPAGIYYTNYLSPGMVTIPLVTTKAFPYANTVGTAKIPNSGIASDSGNSIGNIAFDYKNNQLFATSLEDGRIYRINPSTGIVKSIFDPFGIDPGNSSPGIAASGEQLWGVGVLTLSGVTSVYFARTTTTGKEIWSVNLDGSGEFIATSAGGGLFTDIGSTAVKKEISTVPGSQAKITDIAFSSTGRMLLAERGKPHFSKVFEYLVSGTSWIPANNFYVGAVTPGQNSAGGVDYSNREVPSFIPNFLCNDIVWASGNAMETIKLPYTGISPNPYPKLVYGVQGMSASGNSSSLISNKSTDLYIDYNCTGNGVLNHTTAVKGKIGDVEFFDAVCPCK